MMLEIARFWASIAHLGPDRGRYEIHGVMGPDEFHERYPDVTEGGLRNNAYTNVMVAWLCRVAVEMLAQLPESRARALRQRLGLTDEDIGRWDDMSRRMFVPFHDDGIISQFEGYADLEELDWDGYRERYGNIQRLDRILRAEGDDPDRYRLSKQADAVMLFYLFSPEELSEIFGRLGYEHDPALAERTIAYYDRRTSHGSTLSFITHAGVLASSDPDSSWSRFLVALESDVDDIQGGTTKEGIHLGVMAGTLDLVQRRFAGVRISGGAVCVSPCLPRAIDRVAFPMLCHGIPLEIAVDHRALTVTATGEPGTRSLPVQVGGERLAVEPGHAVTFDRDGR
jgi:trehalose/maltose hydrolase-like predicted phosphorylase